MKLRLSISIILLLFQLGTRPQDKAAIEGYVLRSGSGEPLTRAEVTLTKAPPSTTGETKEEENSDPPMPSVTTDEKGRFTLQGIEPGQYRLKAARNGYTTTEYGQRVFPGQGTVMTLAPGQTMRDVTFRLQQAATVSGHVRDSAGEPTAGMTVTLLSYHYDSDGTRTFIPVGSDTTDDRGQYRIFWLTPGRYYLSVSSDGGFLEFPGGKQNLVREKGMPTIYFPGTVDSSRASVIEVTPGAELSGIDVVLSKPATYRIKGTVIDGVTGKPPKDAQISLEPRSGGSVKFMNFRGPEIIYRNGTFEIGDVVPGAYWLRARVSPDWEKPLPGNVVNSGLTPGDLFGVIFSGGNAAQAPIDVVGSNIDNVALTLVPPMSVPVRISVEGQELSSVSGLDRLRVFLWATSGGMSLNPGGISAAQRGPIDARGMAVLDNVFPGDYRGWIEGPLPNPDLYLKQATIDRIDALNGVWEIRGPVSGMLDVVLSSKGGRIDGTLLDDKFQPVSGIPVVLIPDSSRYRDELYKKADTDQSGHFTFRGVPPGGYKVFAWEALEAFAYYDPEVIRRYERDGKPVRIQESSKETIEVRIIPAPK